MPANLPGSWTKSAFSFAGSNRVSWTRADSHSAGRASGCFEEIAERKRVEEDLRELTGRLLRLRDLIKQNSSFVSNLSVEIQTISHLLHPPLLDEVGLGGWIAKIY
jgi:hypothetical protein